MKFTLYNLNKPLTIQEKLDDVLDIVNMGGLIWEENEDIV